MATFGEKLKAARKAAGLSQRDLAEAVGAKHNSVCNWEKDVNRPSQDTLVKICEKLNVSSNSLLGTDPGPDDFTYALYNEVQGLTEENRQKLLEMAKFFKTQQG